MEEKVLTKEEKEKLRKERQKRRKYRLLILRSEEHTSELQSHA